ncbi:hypothetical protein O3P69_000867 [Scylla paramamosain]|uniref:Vitellinogen open beta-sheet domain-containing protein n=1 Tax=Scylla paramamosain TaxID=85552 RepID=A0AAW0UT93_SCYPA
MIPRSLVANLTAALDGTGIPINIGEIGARLEGMEPIIAQLLGPASYLKTSSYSKMFNDLVSFIQKHWSTIKQELEVAIRERRSVDYAALESIISKLYGPSVWTVPGRLFCSLSGSRDQLCSLSEQLQDINIHHLVEASVRYLMQMLSSLKNMNLDKMRAAHLGLDYSFPTIQGTPLKMTWETVAVAGIKMETNLNGQGGSGSKLKILPSFSVETHGFIGYDAYISKSGLKMNTTVSSSNGVAIKVGGQSSQELQIEVDIPDKMEIIRVHSETFLMKHTKNQPDTKILPPSMQDVRVHHNSCFTALESVFGIKMCYDVNVPDIFRANALPLGSPALVTLSVNKIESTITGYKIAVNADTATQDKKYAAKVSVVGSSSPKEANVEVNLKKDSESYLAEVKLLSSVTHGKARINFINRPEQMSFQADFSFTNNGMEFLQLTLDHMMPSMVMHISAETKNSLMQYIPFSLEAVVNFKYYNGVPSQCGCANLNSRLASTLLHEKEMLIDFQVDLRLQGTHGVDFIEQLFVNAKIGQTEYEMQQRIECQETRRAISLQLTRKSDNVKLLEIGAEKDSHKIKFIFWVQMPAHGAYQNGCRRCTTGRGLQCRGNYHAWTTNSSAAHGPVTHMNSPTLAKFGANIKINNLYQFVFSFEYEESKQTVLLEIKKGEEMLLSLEGNVKTPSSQGFFIQAKLHIPILFDGNTEISITENVIHISTNTLLLPHSPSPRRIKAFLDINWSQKQGQMMVLWNADKDSSQKIALDVNIVPESGRPAEATLHIKLMLLNKAYHPT